MIDDTKLHARAMQIGHHLDMQRTNSRPPEARLPMDGNAKGSQDAQALWEAIQRMLTDKREQRLAYLLFHCGLKPKEIVQLCPQEFDDLQEIARLRVKVFRGLMG